MKKFNLNLDKIHRCKLSESITVVMKKTRPSNVIIKIFVAILLLFGFFAIAAIINHGSQQFLQNEVEVESPSN